MTNCRHRCMPRRSSRQSPWRASHGWTRARTTRTALPRNDLSLTCMRCGVTRRGSRVADHFNASEWLLDRNVEAGNGHRTALLHGDATATYAQLLGDVKAAASGLRGLGIRPEERVLLILRDGPALATAILAAMRIGAVALPVNPLLPPRDLVAIAQASRARRVIVAGDAEPLIKALRGEVPQLSALIRVAAGGDGPLWSDVLGGGDDDSVDTTSAESPCFWLCTSGTTGRPKLAMHRHADVRSIC